MINSLVVGRSQYPAVLLSTICNNLIVSLERQMRLGIKNVLSSFEIRISQNYWALGENTTSSITILPQIILLCFCLTY